jgi:hypothetical protein
MVGPRNRTFCCVGKGSWAEGSEAQVVSRALTQPSWSFGSRSSSGSRRRRERRVDGSPACVRPGRPGHRHRQGRCGGARREVRATQIRRRRMLALVRTRTGRPSPPPAYRLPIQQRLVTNRPRSIKDPRFDRPLDRSREQQDGLASVSTPTKVRAPKKQPRSGGDAKARALETIGRGRFALLHQPDATLRCCF